MIHRCENRIKINASSFILDGYGFHVFVICIHHSESYQNCCFQFPAVGQTSADPGSSSIFDDFESGRLPGWILASGLPLASLRPDSLRSPIFDDFGSGQPRGWIPGSGLPLESLRPGLLRSFIFDDFESGRLPGWIPASGLPLAGLRPSWLR